MANPTQVIAIDGPAAVGKGTVSKMVAEELGFLPTWIPAGFYRAIASLAIRVGADLSNPVAVLAPAKKYLEEQGGLEMLLPTPWLDGEDVARRGIAGGVAP